MRTFDIVELRNHVDKLLHIWCNEKCNAVKNINTHEHEHTRVFISNMQLDIHYPNFLRLIYKHIFMKKKV